MSMLLEIGRRARAASQWLAQAGTAEKNAALFAMARRLLQSADEILVANATDLATARELKPSLVDRLTLTPARIEAMATGIEEIAALTDPVGRVLAEWTRPNGLRFSRVSVPLGVIGIIYESRPNVTADAGALCVKSGNAAVLRGGSDSFESSSAIVAALRKGLHDAKLPMDVIQMVGTRDRAAVGELLSGLAGTIDLIVPRGGKSLVARVQSDARVPVFSHLEGICHVYVDKAADLDMAESILINAKMRRTGICGAAETLLVDQAIVATAMPRLVRALMNAGCEVRGDLEAQRVDAGVLPATEEDWQTEYLAAVISVCAVDGVEGAINHICKYGSQHTDSIITGDSVTAETFMHEVDSAIVLHNASTQFADGGEFGFGAEIGIATGKLHARGPVGVEQLTTFKYKVRGEGQVRAI